MTGETPRGDTLVNSAPEENAVMYCDSAFGTTNGKTAHGLVHQTQRYHVSAVVDHVSLANIPSYRIE